MASQKVSVSHLALSDAQVRELINAIRANPILYKKSSAAYKDKQQKTEAWNALTSTLSFHITGPEAALKFKYLRDSMSREIKKGRDVNPGRSGPGVVDGPPIFKSSWPSFYDLLFLTDHISPRTDTCSTYVKPCISGESSGGSSLTGASVLRGAIVPSRESSSTGTDNSTSQDGMSRSSTPVSLVETDSSGPIPHFLDISASSDNDENNILPSGRRP